MPAWQILLASFNKVTPILPYSWSHFARVSIIPVSCHWSTVVQPLRNVLLSRCSYDLWHVACYTGTGSRFLNEFWWRKSSLFAYSTLFSRLMAAARPRTEVICWKVVSLVARTLTQNSALCAFRAKHWTRNRPQETLRLKPPAQNANVLCCLTPPKNVLFGTNSASTGNLLANGTCVDRIQWREANVHKYWNDASKTSAQRHVLNLNKV